MRINNVHQRRLRAPVEQVGALLETLSSPDDRLWPVAGERRWPPMRLDGPLAPGARGGHGPVRYRVIEHDPGRRVVFQFEPGGLTDGVHGQHGFEVVGDGEATVLRHFISAEARGRAALRWTVLIRPLHDALLEDALDRAELHLTARVERPARWSPWVRVLRRLVSVRGPARRGRRGDRGGP